MTCALLRVVLESYSCHGSEKQEDAMGCRGTAERQTGKNIQTLCGGTFCLQGERVWRDRAHVAFK